MKLVIILYDDVATIIFILFESTIFDWRVILKLSLEFINIPCIYVIKQF
jgi:hypothetical protein